VYVTPSGRELGYDIGVEPLLVLPLGEDATITLYDYSPPPEFKEKEGFVTARARLRPDEMARAIAFRREHESCIGLVALNGELVEEWSNVASWEDGVPAGVYPTMAKAREVFAALGARTVEGEVSGDALREYYASLKSYDELAIWQYSCDPQFKAMIDEQVRAAGRPPVGEGPGDEPFPNVDCTVRPKAKGFVDPWR
jgi:hypothetical protein